MFTIKILGTGCPNCKKLEAVTRQVLEADGIEAEIQKVTEMEDIMTFGILSTPGLVINDKVYSYGRIPNSTEMRTWLQQANQSQA